MSYKALVTRISVQPAPGLDNLLLGTCCGYQVLVGKDVKDGDLGLFFEQGGQLSEEFATANDLIRRKDENGKPAGGMFEPNRRVKAIKLKGIRSEGFWCPLSLLNAKGIGNDALDPYRIWGEGDQLDSYNTVPICNKYETPATKRAGASHGSYSGTRKETHWFKRHKETEDVRRSLLQLVPGSILTITEKVHGTSHATGYVLEESAPSFWDKLFRRKPNLEHRYLTRSRNVVLRDPNEIRFYGKEGFRYAITNSLRGRLRKGEVVYGELCGFTETGSPIMPPHTPKGDQQKAWFGDQLNYNYGAIAERKETRFFVYRIVQTTEDGAQIELSWPQIRTRCSELGLQPVPHLEGPIVVPMLTSDDETKSWFDGVLMPMIQMHAERPDGEFLPSSVDTKTPREGVVIRVDQPTGRTVFLKHKGYAFKVAEGIIKDDVNYVDTEEAA